MVSLRFESSRTAVELTIVNTLRDALARRNGGSSSTGVTSSDIQAGTPTGGMLSSGEVVHTRCLIRTLALTLGLPELRSLAALRLEPWLTVSVKCSPNLTPPIATRRYHPSKFPSTFVFF